jgi:hypothetical protein
MRYSEYNLWTGFDVSPTYGDKHHHSSEHLKNVICDGQKMAFITLGCWIADMYQHPADKPGGGGDAVEEEGLGRVYWDSGWRILFQPTTCM